MSKTLDCPVDEDLMSGDVVWPRRASVVAVPTPGMDGFWERLLEAMLDMLPDWLPDDWVSSLAPALDELDTWVTLFQGALGGPDEPQASQRINPLMDFGILQALQGRGTMAGVEAGVGDATLGRLYVGHVGMIERDRRGKLWVIESSYVAGGVHVLPWSEWKRHRLVDQQALVWHGRVTPIDGKPLSKAQTELMVETASDLRMQGKKYAIFDTEAGLGNLDYVYCSEMVWLCAKAAGVDLDARDPYARMFPFLGPQALTRSPFMRMLNKPHGQDY